MACFIFCQSVFCPIPLADKNLWDKKQIAEPPSWLDGSASIETYSLRESGSCATALQIYLLRISIFFG